MSKPMADRRWDVFLSHAHEDKPIVERVLAWCRKAEMEPWFDTTHLSGRMLDEIAEAIDNSRAGIAFVSKASLASNYCKEEWTQFREQALQLPDFASVSLRVDDSPVPAAMTRRRYIDISQSGFDPRAATEMLEDLYAPGVRANTWNHRPVYFARGSRGPEAEAAGEVIEALRSRRIRVVRDASINTDDSLAVRVRRILQGCHGFVGLISDRRGQTSLYILLELLIAIDEGLPVLLIVDETLPDDVLGREFGRFVQDLVRSKNPERDAEQVREIAEELAESVPVRGLAAISRNALRIDWRADRTRLGECLDDFNDDLRLMPRDPAQTFFGHAYGGESTQRYAYARRALEAVSGIPCKSGDDFRADRPGVKQQPRIIDAIKSSTFAVFDIANDRGDMAINTCIEAGVALGVGIPLYLVARGVERQTRPDPEFMLAHYHINYYADDTELVALMRKIGMRYRRVTE